MRLSLVSGRGLPPAHGTGGEGSIRAMRLVIAIAAILLSASTVKAGSLSGSLPQGLLFRAPFVTVAQALATSTVRAVPVVSASAGIVYRFDWQTGSFVREPSHTTGTPAELFQWYPRFTGYDEVVGNVPCPVLVTVTGTLAT